MDEPIGQDRQDGGDSLCLTKPLQADEFVAVVYEDEWYIGKVVAIGEGRARLIFMENEEESMSKDSGDASALSKYKWPRRTDRAWVKDSGCVVWSCSSASWKMQTAKILHPI